MIVLDLPTFFLRLVVAALLGAMVGFERNRHGRPAGLRTHLLVSLGSASFVILSAKLPTVEYQHAQGMTQVFDPARIAAQIITGIGFIGAGVILKDGVNIRGLTTAACLWVTASIGMAAGGGFFLLALVVAVLATLSLMLMPWLEKFYKKDQYYTIILTLPLAQDMTRFQVLFDASIFKLLGHEQELDLQQGTKKLTYFLNFRSMEKSSGSVELFVDQLLGSGMELRSIKWFQS